MLAAAASLKIPLKKKQPSATAAAATAVSASSTSASEGSVAVEEKWFLDKPIEAYSWEPSGVYRSSSGVEHLLPNNKQFSNWIRHKYAKYKMVNDIQNTCGTTTKTGISPMFMHQAFISDYMSPDKPNRGTLIEHDLGSGKSRTTIETAEQYRIMGVRPLILLPATLRSTWIDEIKKWGYDDVRRPTNYGSLSRTEQFVVDAKLDAKIMASYDFVSYNASNTLAQLNKVSGGQLKHRFIVADEVHNLISMLVNPTGKKGAHLYRALMDVIDCKFIFASATPLLNTPFELGIMFNILRGYMTQNGVKHTLFPENEMEFDEYFVDYETKKVRNPELFKKRILGLVSYYYGAKGDVYPELVLHPPAEIAFSDYQFSRYMVVREEEIKKELGSRSDDSQRHANLSGKGFKIKGKVAAAAAGPSTDDKVTSTFRIFSRQYSNYVFPDKIKRPLPHDYSALVYNALPANPKGWSADQQAELLDLFDGDMTAYNDFKEAYSSLETDADRLQFLQDTIEVQGKEGQEFANITSDEEQFIYQHLDLADSYKKAIENSLRLLDANKQLYFRDMLNILSPKMELIYRNIMEGEGCTGPAFVYSQFRTLEGVNIFARVLDANGFVSLPYDSINTENIQTFVGKNRYLIYSGEEDIQVRNKMLWINNHPLNSHGEICKVFMGTAAAAEGISLKNMRQVHIMEPYWNEVRIQQVIGRARRICSHEGLPKDERKVHVYRYHMILTEKQQIKIGEKESTDQALYRIAKIKEAINLQFLQILKDAAVDCALFAYHNVTATNPIACFAFDEKETGIAFYPTMKEETLDKMFTITYKQAKIQYAVFNIYGPSDIRFYENGDYLYVYKYAGDPSIIREEKIVIPSKKAMVMATVLYDYVVAKNGNIFQPKKAIVGKIVIPATAFELAK